ncbi:hypothetical protein QEN58_03705 [Halomonas alkaliantarctica]|uniref:Uncharacterized protein n=1 Tax=Halomonas alkaliantarctica TaxID=232346 RepID=A0ABY8LP42_9GAMM|nr:hypothetical protein [Halomonas alkaliantarctica]WGI26173.1 hypothetical protein QEN58_03705 [Halomonas alkaliantarctica]
MARETYKAQVALLVHILPDVAKEDVFALKGGTPQPLCALLSATFIHGGNTHGHRRLDRIIG